MTDLLFNVPVQLDPVRFVYNDGGRSQAGFRGVAGDCVTRSIAIVTGFPYKDIYDELSQRGRNVKPTRSARPKPSARNGVFAPVYKKFIQELGLIWTPTMFIGSGTTTHLVPHELPPTGRHIIRCSKHLTALIDGRIHDIFDPSRNGSRAVYGYWSYPTLSETT